MLWAIDVDNWLAVGVTNLDPEKITLPIIKNYVLHIYSRDFNVSLCIIKRQT